MMNEDNFKQVLRAEDYLILLESDEENLRRGNFRRVFPTLENIKLMEPCFDVERPNNLLLWKYLDMRSRGVNILDCLFKKP